MNFPSPVLPRPETIADDVVLYRDVMIAAADGIGLATDIYRPAAAGAAIDARYPVVLERTPYGKNKPSRAELRRGDKEPVSRADLAALFVRAGYVVVFQDCRGRYGSDGEFTKYLSEGPDGRDTVDWVREQPWCNGRIATFGLSYAAHTQAALACLNPDGLAAMVLDSGGFSNAYQCGIRQGGAFELKQATWAYNHALESPAAKRDPNIRKALEAEDIREWFTRMPWRPGKSPLTATPDYEAYLLDQWSHGVFDDYWKQPGIYAEGFYDQFTDAPTVLMSSWFDAYVKTTLDNYTALKRRKRGPFALIMGPWTHGDRNQTFVGDIDFGPQSTFDGNVAEDWFVFRRRWFDRWLKGPAERGLQEPRVRLFLMGGGSGGRNQDGRLDHGGSWISAKDWPIPTTEFRAYHLHGDGSLSTDAPATDAAPLAYDFDPRDPVPTIGGALTSGKPVFDGGGYDQREDARFFGCRNFGRPLNARPDVLSFETGTLAQDVAVAGPIQIELCVASSAPDTDFTAKLLDIYPPSPDYPEGFALNLTDGIFRCRYRKSWEKPEPIEPGAPFRIVIEPFATANLFKAGHRIRLDISSSNFPHFDVNPNSYEPEGQGDHPVIARNTVYVDAARNSRVILPVVPAKAIVKLPTP